MTRILNRNLVAGVVLLAAASAAALGGAIKQTPSTFDNVLAPRGYKMTSYLNDPNMPFVAYQKRNGDDNYEAEMYVGPDSMATRINVSVSTNIFGDVQQLATPELAAIAAAVCGDKGTDAAKWVRDSIGQNTEQVFGGVRLRLAAPAKTARWLYVTPA